jgi:hypothetical protein
MYGHPIDFTNCDVENLIAVLAKVFNKGEKYSYEEVQISSGYNNISKLRLTSSQ